MQVNKDVLVPSTAPIANNKKAELLAGLKAGLPIALGYIPIAIAFGLLAKATGIPNHISLMMSFFVYAGASQFVAVNLLGLAAGYSEIILTTFILNLRHILMSASLNQRILQPAEKGILAVLSYGITDETFSVASLQKKQKLSVYFLLALNLAAFLAWNIGTAMGIFLAEGLPEELKSSMGIALYAMFVGLLVPSLGKSRPILIVSLLAAVLHSILHWIPFFSNLSTGWAIVLSTVLAALAGSLLFPEGGEKGE
ncbi:AzlC family ABC transporter permease [Ammoniphilus resinae]|uniref:4-azaleucine resistance transporter AzlC n=1 Tax=Ammoniphilus resinae TaxID=861532 RepID=A0ABS4GRL7_9BACL|nr:AzlC family ABC transporter permease [Ammoniphilus resinae]MBP1932911.1 4-azaleucine resistance transporter AzlC [Ammoniphilus resinae]